MAVSLTDKRLKMMQEIRAKADLTEVLEQTEMRKALVNQMVGTLYPSILRDEILELMKLERQLKNEIRENMEQLVASGFGNSGGSPPQADCSEVTGSGGLVSDNDNNKPILSH